MAHLEFKAPNSRENKQCLFKTHAVFGRAYFRAFSKFKKIKIENVLEPGIDRVTPGMLGEHGNHYTTKSR